MRWGVWCLRPKMGAALPLQARPLSRSSYEPCCLMNEPTDFRAFQRSGSNAAAKVAQASPPRMISAIALAARRDGGGLGMTHRQP